MNRKQHLSRFLFGVLVLVFLLGANLAAKAQSTKRDPKVVQLVNGSGYQAKDFGDGIWLLDLKGTQKPKIELLLASGPDFVVFGVILATKSEMSVNAEMMFKLMKFNNAYDYVKLGFDNDDDLFLRAEIKTKSLDRTEFNETIERVRKDADEVFGAIKPYLTRR
ncbi:MAG TPA: hypothetical protein VJS64_19335 [Pyrinomonadaceae bacterium]|nr:hypothetical protein [Pyrinomonadaceae bacterium]